MTYNTSSGQSLEELLERAAAAIVREWSAWGCCTEAEARAAVERNFVRQQRLGEIAHEWAWRDDQDVPDAS